MVSLILVATGATVASLATRYPAAAAKLEFCGGSLLIAGLASIGWALQQVTG